MKYNLKIIGLLVLFVATTMITSAQAPKFNWGQPTKHPEMSEFESAVLTTDDEEGFYKARWKYNSSSFNYDVFLDQYDGNYEIMNSIDISPPSGAWEIERKFEKLTFRNGKILMFTNNFIKANKKNRLYVHTINLNGEYEKEQEVTHINAEKAMNRGTYQIAVSDNGKYTAILQETPFQKKTSETVILGLYDENFEEIAGQTFSLEYPSKRVVKNKVVVTDEGEVFFLKAVNAKKYEFNRELFHWNRLSKKLNGSKIDLGDMDVMEDEMILTDEQEIILSGYYSKNAFNRTRHGWFYQRFSQTGERLSKGMGELDKTGTDIHIKYLQPTEDGGVILMGEVSSESLGASTGTTAGAVPERSKTYVTGNILAHRIDGNGKLTWMNTLKRENKSTNDGGYLNGYIYAYHNSNLYLLYNDWDYRFNGKKIIATLNPLKIATLVTITTDGEVIGKPLGKSGIGLNQPDFKVCGNEFFKIGEGKYLVKGANRIQYKFGSMVFE